MSSTHPAHSPAPQLDVANPGHVAELATIVAGRTIASVAVGSVNKENT